MSANPDPRLCRLLYCSQYIHAAADANRRDQPKAGRYASSTGERLAIAQADARAVIEDDALAVLRVLDDTCDGVFCWRLALRRSA